MSGLTSQGLSNTDDSIDLSHIEELDPSLNNGYRLLYDREVPIEIRSVHALGEKTNSGVLESIKVKIVALGLDSAPHSIRMELSSEADLFFVFLHTIDPDLYAHVQDQQQLMVDFSDYPNVLIRMLNACIREPHVHLAIFTMVGAGNEGTLEFIQNMEYKFVELMSCAFDRAPEEVVQHQITYRYNSVKSRLAIMQARLFELNNLVKTKNPSLLLHLQSPQKAPSTSVASPLSNRR